MTDRFKILLQKLQLTASEFADRIGVQRSSVSHILSGRNKPSIDFLEKILQAFPDTDVNWLITGNESMHEIKAEPKREMNALVTGSENQLPMAINENKIPAQQGAEPVEKIIIVYRDNTFQILYPAKS
jgi:transcriptional regulator with XRE-family HTH domain